MNKRRRMPALLALGALLVLPGLRAQQAKPAALTLEDCIVQAVKRNLGVAAQVLTYRQSDVAVSQAGEKFYPSLSFDYTGQNQNSASYSWIQSASVLATKSMVYTAGLSQTVPFGGRLSVSVDADKYDSNASFQTINPRYDGQLSFSYTQPLLKNFGWETSRKEILVARNSRDMAENDLKTTLLQTVFAVESAYWEYVYRIETLKVERQSLGLAEALLDKSRKEIDIGTLAPKEILSSQAEVASIKADILQAEMMVKDSADQLRGLINQPFDKDVVEIMPADTPGFVKREVSLDEALAVALKNRPDLQSSALGIKNRELDYSYAKNQMLPQLDLRAQYWSPGLSGDRILYLNDNPLTGIILGKAAGGASQALRDALGFKYSNWSVELTLTIPLSSIFSRAAQAAAKAGLDQQIVLLKQAEQTAFLEIRAAVRAMQTNFERVGARKVARGLAEQKLEAEESKLKVGLSNNFFVLNYQRDLALAKTAELRAMIDYTLSLGQLDKAMGVSLDKRNIRVTDAAEDQR